MPSVGACARWFLRLVSVLLIAAALGAGALLARLAQGPLAVDRVAEIVEARVNAEFGALRVAIGGSEIAWNAEDNRIALRLTELAVLGADGRRAVSAEAARVAIDLESALLGAIEIRSVELLGARLLLRRTRAGEVEVAVLSPGEAGDAAAAPETFAAVSELIARASATGGGRGAAAFERFERLTLKGVELRYVDEASGADWRLPNGELMLERGEAGLGGALTGDVWTTPDGAPTSIEIVAERDEAAQTARLNIRFDGASPEMIASQLPGVAGLLEIDGGLSGAAEARLRLDEPSALAALSGEITAEALALRRPARRPIALDAAEVAFRWDADSDRLTIERLEARRGPSEARASGAVSLVRDAEGGVAGAEGALRLERLFVDDPSLFSAPLDARGSAGAIALSLDPLRLDVSDVALETDAVRFEGRGDWRAGPEPSGRIALGFERLAARALPDLWPLSLASGGRRWIDENILGGDLRDGQLRAVLDHDGARLDFLFDFDDLAGTHIAGMTPITRAGGRARLRLGRPIFGPEAFLENADPATIAAADGRFDLLIDRGEVALPEGGRIDVAGSRFAIPTFEPNIPPAEIVIRAGGAVPTLLTFLDQEPLGYISAVGLTPSEIRGAAQSETRLALPLARALEFEDIVVDADATLSNLEMAAPGLGKLVAAETAAVDVTSDRFRLRGAAMVEGQPLTIEWREIFQPTDGAARTEVAIGATLTADSLRRLGAPLEMAQSGSLEVRTAIQRFDDDKDLKMRLRLDFRDLAMAGRAIAWRKEAGAPGRAEIDAAITEDEITLTRISAALGDLDLAGEGALRSDGDVKRLALTRFRVGDDTDLSVLLSRETPDGPVALALTGASLDLRRAIADGSAGAPAPPSAGGDLILQQYADLDAGRRLPAAPPPELYIDATIKKVRIGDATALFDVSANGTLEEGASQAVVTAVTIDGAPLTLELNPSPRGQRFKLVSDQAGEALKGLGAFDDGAGGDMTIRGVVRGDGRVEGDVAIDGLVVRNAPVLARILSIGSVIGALDQLSAGGITFARVRGDYAIANGVLQLREAAATGPALGLTLEGEVALEEETADFSGSVSPAYAVNGLVSRVPVLNKIFTGGRGEGVFGVAFTVKGPLADPTVTVNPLSAFALGPLQRLFRYRRWSEPQREAEEERGAPPGDGFYPNEDPFDQ